MDVYKFVAFDPGINTGVACFNERGEPNYLAILKGFDKLYDFLDRIELQQPPVSVIIYERYRVAYGRNNYHQDRFAKIHAGRSVPAEQAIGAILRTCRKIPGLEVVAQEPSILPMALLHAGIPKPKGHLPDDRSAFAHGYEYLLHQGLIKARVLNEQKRESSTTTE